MTTADTHEQRIEQQRAHNARSLAMGSILRSTGWIFSASLDAFCKGSVRIFMSTGDIYIQRRLQLEEVAYLRFVVKCPGMPARDVEDSLDVDVDVTFRALMDVVEDMQGQTRPELCAA